MSVVGLGPLGSIGPPSMSRAAYEAFKTGSAPLKFAPVDDAPMTAERVYDAVARFRKAAVTSFDGCHYFDPSTGELMDLTGRVSVVTAVIERSGKFLLGLRAGHRHHAYEWETPGGKVELGESHRAALTRELDEETELIPVEVDARPFAVLLFDPPVTPVPTVVHFYRVQVADTATAVPRDHVALGWFSEADMDRVPCIVSLRQLRALGLLCAR